MTDVSSGAERLARIVDGDANAAVNRVLRVAESDLAALLGEYMSVKSLDMRVKKEADGYTLEIRANVERFFDVGHTSDV